MLGVTEFIGWWALGLLNFTSRAPRATKGPGALKGPRALTGAQRGGPKGPKGPGPRALASEYYWHSANRTRGFNNSPHGAQGA